MTDISDTEQAFLDLIHGTRVVVFHSPLSDTRRLRRGLETSGLDFEEVEMPMDQREIRERYRYLALMTGWKTLPQIFVDGDFVGGVQEALEHPAFAGVSENGSRARVGQALGYGGLAPFVVSVALLLWDQGPVPREAIVPVLEAYGAIVLSFIGAVSWGLALRGIGTPFVFFASIVPAFIGWVSLLLSPPLTFSVQAGAFAVIHAFERSAFWQHAFPHWYRRLRVILTIIVCATLVLAAVVTAQ